LPPISHCTFAPRAAQAATMRRPVATEPVKLIALTEGESTNVAPTFEPGPITRLKTPFGIDVRERMSAIVQPQPGTSSAGLKTTQLPKASAGAIFHAGIAIGKFHGAIRPTTPIGSRNTSTPTPGRTDRRISPPGRSASPAKNLKIIAARTVSPMPSGSVLPSSRESRRPISSLRASSSLPTASSTSKRCCGVLRLHAGNAARAAAIALSVCATSACA
jgi:hypothetical protein